MPGLRLEQEIDEVSEEKRYPLGTRLVIGRPVHRYCQAGDDLVKGFPAFLHYEGELGREFEAAKLRGEGLIIGQEQWEAVWADIRAVGTRRELCGWPTASVPRGQFFWLREII